MTPLPPSPSFPTPTPSHASPDRDRHVINALKGLVMDGVYTASSGHPGGAMSSMDFAYLLFTEFLRWDPQDPQFLGRDRFILSAGHESMLLYALFYAAGWLNLKDLQTFRQLHSRTPGHPEYGLTPGVECTTGPLGQGAGMSVGFAIANSHLATALGADLFHSRIWALLGDGCMQEDVTLGAASLAGHLGLSNLIWFYDKNHAQISGPISRVTSDDETQIFEGMGWKVLELTDGHDLQALRQAYQDATDPASKQPVLIIANTRIAYGAHSMEGSYHAHGAPFTQEEITNTKAQWQQPTDQTFYLSAQDQKHFQRHFSQLSEQAQQWQQHLQQKCTDPAYQKLFHHYFPPDPSSLPPLPELTWCEHTPCATRSAFGKILAAWAPILPALMGGSADLEPSNKTEAFAQLTKDFTASHPQGRNLAFGVREFPMACIANGLALHGGIIPFTATFLAFSDYMRPAIRLAALQKVRVLFVFSHDSFHVGEDGPTHQPIEHVMSLRLIPDLLVMRPADGPETAAMFTIALQNSGPCALVLTRQNLEPLPALCTQPPPSQPTQHPAHRGAWVVLNTATSSCPDYILFATGSEVPLAIKTAHILTQHHHTVQVVSLPCMELFWQQDPAYQKSILCPQCSQRISIEAGSTLGWERFIGPHGLSIGIDTFGMSAPSADLAQYFGFHPQAIADRILLHPFHPPSAAIASGHSPQR